MRILVIDDDPTCNEFLTLFLKDEGYNVRGAHRAAEAIEIAEHFDPQLLIADWLLKDGMDGAELAYFLQNRRKDLKIIFTTGSPAEQLAEQVQELSVLKIMEKPIEIEDLLSEIKGISANDEPPAAIGGK